MGPGKCRGLGAMVNWMVRVGSLGRRHLNLKEMRVSSAGTGERPSLAGGWEGQGQAEPARCCGEEHGVGETGVGHVRGSTGPAGQEVTSQTTREKPSAGVSRTWVWLPEGGRMWGWCSATHAEGQWGREGGWQSPCWVSALP